MIHKKKFFKPAQSGNPAELVGAKFAKTINGTLKMLEVLNFVQVPSVKSDDIPHEFYVVGIKRDPNQPSRLGENVEAAIGVIRSKMFSVIQNPDLLVLRGTEEWSRS